MLTLIFLVGFLVAIQLKHMLVDFFWQPAYMWKNKGTLTHPGGYLHAGAHSAGSFLVFLAFGLDVAVTVAAVDFFAHYAIDYWKVNANRKDGAGPLTDPVFWERVGIDQFLHQVTYIGLVVIALLMTGVAP